MKRIYFVFILVAGCGMALAQQINFPQDTIAYNALFNNRQFPAFDSQGRLHISYTGQLGTDGATREIYYVSESGGSFLTTNVTNNNVDDNYSSLHIDRNDKVHIGFTGRDAATLFQVKYTNNVHGVFFTPIFITTAGLNKATPVSAIGRDSVMHFVYYTFTTGADNVYYRKFDLRNSTLSAEHLLSDGETSGEFDASVVTDSQAQVHLVLKAGALGGGALRYFNNRSGTITQIPTSVSVNVEYPRILIGDGDKVHILYRNAVDKLLYITGDSAGTFTSPLAITPAGQRPSTFNNFGIDSTGRLYIVYQSSQSGSGRGFYLVHGKDRSFSDTLKIYDLTPEYVTRNTSAVAARGNGEIALFYAPGGVRSSIVICDIFMKRGNLFGPTPAPAIGVSKDSITLNIPNLWQDTLFVRNNGTMLLRVDSMVVRSQDPNPLLQRYFISPPAFTLQPGDSQRVVVILNVPVHATEDLNFADSLYIFSNDPIRPERILHIDVKNYPTSVEEGTTHTPAEIALFQNYPNPFNPVTNFRFSTINSRLTILKVYDVLGRDVATLVNEVKPEGTYVLQWDASHLSSGIYYYRLSVIPEAGQGPTTVLTRKMLLLR